MNVSSTSSTTVLCLYPEAGCLGPISLLVFESPYNVEDGPARYRQQQ